MAKHPKVVLRALQSLLLAGLVLTGAGCRHYAGWVDRQIRVTPLSAADPRTEAKTDIRLRVTRTPTASSSVLEVGLVQPYAVRRRVNRELIAKRTYARYHWSTPLVKPLVAVTIFFPFYFSYIDPHNHRGATWDKWDYLRDVFAYWNVFEAWPGGAHRMEKEWTVLWSERRHDTVPTREDPIPGARVEIRLGDRRLGHATTDAEGVARFDLRPHLTAKMAGADREFAVLLMEKGAKRASDTAIVNKEVLRALLSAR